jgi:acyl carrier protein
MDRSEVRAFIIDRLKEKLLLFDIAEEEVKDGFDLVKSGLLDSMAFVDLIAGIEEEFDLEIDFEKAADTEDFTSLGGLVQIITEA